MRELIPSVRELIPSVRELIPSVRELGEGMRELDETFTIPSLLESVLEQMARLDN